MAARICLNMIVRNEEEILDRCLRSHIGAIDCFAIHDTGSTDDTITIIERFAAETGIDGIVTHGSFEDFGQARNDALDAALASALEFDHLLFADADMELVVLDEGWRDEIVGPSHFVLQRIPSGSLEYPNSRIVRRDHPCRYVGATHEYLEVGHDPSTLRGIRYIDHMSGSSRIEKHERDIRLLERSLADDPDDHRAWFYLGNTLMEVGRLDDAIAAYRRRLEFTIYPGERFVSAFRIGRCLDRLGRSVDAFEQMMAASYAHPDRAEALHWCAQRALDEGRYPVAHLLATRAKGIPKPRSDLFVDASVYEWRLDDIVAVALYWIGDYAASAALSESILPLVPEAKRPRIEANIGFAQQKLAELEG